MDNRSPPMLCTDWKALLKEYFAGWSTMNPQKVRHLYDQSSVSYFFDMGHAHRDFDEYASAAAKRMKQFSSFGAELKELLSVVQSQSGDLVTTIDICTVRVQMHDPANPKPPGQFEALHTVVWSRHPDGRWLIVHEHQSEVPTSRSQV